MKNINKGDKKMNNKIIVEFSRKSLKTQCCKMGCLSHELKLCKKDDETLIKCATRIGVRFKIK